MPVADLILGALRRDADTSPVADGATHSVFSNEEGRVKVTARPSSFPNASATLTGTAQTVAADVSRASNATVHIKGGATAGAGGNFAFEASLDSTDGTDGTWFGIQAALTNANTIVTATGVLGLAIGAGHTAAWEMSVNAYNWVRVRCTAYTSGQYIVTLVRGSYATEPVPAIQPHAVTGSGNFAVTNALLATGAAGLGKAEDAAHVTGDVGVLMLSVRNDDAAATLTSATGDNAPIATDANGALFTRDKPAPTTAVTSVASSASSVTLLAASAARRGATIYNDSTAVLYVKLGATASTSSFTVALAPKDANGIGGYYEVPFDYSGIIDGIWASANGNARVTAVS